MFAVQTISKDSCAFVVATGRIPAREPSRRTDTSAFGALLRSSREPPESLALTIGFRSKLLRALVIWAGAIAIAFVVAAMHTAFD